MNLTDQIITELAKECGYRCVSDYSNIYTWANADKAFYIIVIDDTILKFPMNNQTADLNDPNVLESIKTIIDNYYNKYPDKIALTYKPPQICW